MVAENNRITIPQDFTPVATTGIGSAEGVATFTPGDNNPRLRKLTEIIALAMASGGGQTPAPAVDTLSIAFGNAAPVYDADGADFFLRATGDGLGRLYIKATNSYREVEGTPINIADFEAEINAFADNRVRALVPAWVLNSPAPTYPAPVLSATLIELENAVQRTHLAGGIIRKSGFTRSVQVDLNVRDNIAGTLTGDTEGMTFGTPHPGTFNGWGKAYNDWRFTLAGFRVAEVPANSSTLVEVLRGDLEAETAIKILQTNATGQLQFVNPAAQTEAVTAIEVESQAGYNLQVGDTLVFEAFPHFAGATAGGIEFICWIFHAAGGAKQFDNVVFRDHMGSNPIAKFSLGGLHLQHATGGPTHNARTPFDRAFLAKHTGYLAHNNLPVVVGSDLQGDPPRNIALGTRKQGPGQTKLTFTDPVDFSAGLTANGKDLLTSAKRKPVVLNPTARDVGGISEHYRFTFPSGKKVGDFETLQLRLSFRPNDSGLVDQARTLLANIPLQTIFPLESPGKTSFPIGMRGASYYILEITPYADSSFTPSAAAETNTAFDLKMYDGNNNAPVGLSAIHKAVLIPL